MGRLTDRVALITGTSRGIGEAIALRFAAEGAKVVCVARTVEEGTSRFEGSLARTVERIRAAGGEATPVQGDTADEASRILMVEQAVEAYGRVDILVNNAAMTTFHPAHEFPLKRWRLGFEVNVHAPYHLASLVLPGMMERRSGAVINLTSSGAIGPDRTGAMYGSSKAALEHMTLDLAVEARPFGVTVAALAPSMLVPTPGATATNLGGEGVDSDRIEPVDYMVDAALLLATEPLEHVAGRVVYSQQLLKEYGLLENARGTGVDREGSGFSRFRLPAESGAR